MRAGGAVDERVRSSEAADIKDLTERAYDLVTERQYKTQRLESLVLRGLYFPVLVYRVENMPFMDVRGCTLDPLCRDASPLHPDKKLPPLNSANGDCVPLDPLLRLA